jgi:putative ABC transport system permease protein
MPFGDINWPESLKVAVDSLWANRLRSLLTIIGLIIGISSVIFVLAFGVGAQQFVKQQLQSLGSNVVGVLDEGGPRTQGKQPLTLADVEAIRTQASTVQNVAPLLYGQGKLTRNNLTAQGRLTGAPASLAEILTITYARGRYFTHAEIESRSRVVILGEELSKQLFQYEDPIGKTVIVNNQTLTVVGITRSGILPLNWVDPNQGLLIPLPLAMESFLESDSPFGKKVGGLLVQGKQDNTIEDVTFEVKNLLRLRHNVTDKEDFIIANVKSVLDLISNVALAITIVLTLTAAISLLVSGVGITNIMLASVLERTREIGLRKALGASEEVILTQFVIEAVLLSSVGGILGVLLGIFGAVVARQFSPVQPEITLWSVLLAVGVSVGTGILFGIAPAQRAANLDPIVALRSN